MAGFTCEETERDDRRVYTVMSYLNSELASGDVHIWSERPSFVFLEWHKMW